MEVQIYNWLRDFKFVADPAWANELIFFPSSLKTVDH